MPYLTDQEVINKVNSMSQREIDDILIIWNNKTTSQKEDLSDPYARLFVEALIRME